MLAIAWATLRPMPGSGPPLPSCFLCAPRAVADALLNVVMFLPVGALLGTRLKVWQAIALGASISGAIEVAQLLIPGRDPTLSDVLFNTLGAALGVALARSARHSLAPTVWLGNALAVAWTVLALGTVALTGWLLEPLSPPPPYTVMWTPYLGGMEQYDGRILEAMIGDEPLRRGAADGPWVERLAGGAPIRVRMTVGPFPERLAPVLTFHDEAFEEAVLLGVRANDLVYRRQTRAHRWHLDAPELRASGILAGRRPGDTVRVATASTAAGQCFAVERDRRCGIGENAGGGWHLLYSGDTLRPVAGKAVNALWLGLLVLPIGYWGQRRTGVVLGLVVAWYTHVRAPQDSVLLPAGWVEAAGLALGIAGGMVLSELARRWLRARGAP